MIKIGYHGECSECKRKINGETVVVASERATPIEKMGIADQARKNVPEQVVCLRCF